MATNLFHKFALATATSATLSLALTIPIPAQAAIFTYDFQFNDAENPVTGSFSYDDSSVVFYPYFDQGIGSSPFPGRPLCSSFPPEQPAPFYCVSGGSSVQQFIDFQITFSGNTFTKTNAEIFNLTWEKDIPDIFGGHIYGPFTNFGGLATWSNPDLSLAFMQTPGPFGTSGFFSTETNQPLGYLEGQFLGTSSFTLRSIEPTSIPEGRQELALLSLGFFSLASLLKKKIFSSQPN